MSIDDRAPNSRLREAEQPMRDAEQRSWLADTPARIPEHSRSAQRGRLRGGAWRAQGLLALAILLVAPVAFAGDPTLGSWSPTSRSGAWPGHRHSPLAPRNLHAARINERARVAIEASARDTMRQIDNGVIVRLGNPNALPLIRRQREVQEELAALRQRERWRRVEANFGPNDERRGRPLASTTGRALDGSAIARWLAERKGKLARDLEAVGTRIEPPPTAPNPNERGARGLGIVE